MIRRLSCEDESRILKAFVMIIYIAHEEYIPMTLKSHPILSINRGFKDSLRSFHSFHGVTSQAWMPEVCIKQAQCLIHFSLYGLR